MTFRSECPRCATVFQVTTEQLREALGWVRCGICQEVFGAQAHSLREPTALLHNEPLALRQETETPDANAATKSGPTAPGPILDSKSVAQRRFRHLLRLAMVFMVFFLLLQVGISKRHTLAGQFPTLARWLQSACGGTETCNVRSIQGVAIEESQFQAIDSSHFRLSAVVSNRTHFDLQAPSFALALTDSGDQIIARKIFGPLDWGAQSSTLAARAAWPVALWIQIDLPSNLAPVVGYRLTAFYP